MRQLFPFQAPSLRESGFRIWYTLTLLSEQLQISEARGLKTSLIYTYQVLKVLEDRRK